jgi:ComF family protein
VTTAGATLLAGLLDFLLPRACALCGDPVEGPPHDAALCPVCLGRLTGPGPLLPPPPPLVAAGAAGRFEGPLREAVHRLKYGLRSELAPSLGRALAAALPAALPGHREGGPWLVVPVPLHDARLVARGFNQAALLARAVAGALGAPLDPLALARVRDTPPQTDLDLAARRANVRGAFAVRRPRRVGGRACLLVDDVVTTGATAAACAAALPAAGAARVALLALARA